MIGFDIMTNTVQRAGAVVLTVIALGALPSASQACRRHHHHHARHHVAQRGHEHFGLGVAALLRTLVEAS